MCSANSSRACSVRDVAEVTSLILASVSPARRTVLRRAGIEPEVIVSGVDEDSLGPLPCAELAGRLAELKARAVAATVGQRQDTLLLGCDSVLEHDGQALGKPHEPDVAAARWRTLRGTSAVLHTGHHLIDLASGRSQSAVGSTTVHFADLTDAEIDAYVATGEPLEVAGAFTIDGFGGAFIERIEGDHHNVIGLSLPLVRVMAAELGVVWPSLWTQN